MDEEKCIRWKKLYDFILKCGEINDLQNFAKGALSQLKEYCKFDQSMIYFLDGNGKVCHQHLINIDKKWSAIYLEYYAKNLDARYYHIQNVREKPTKPMVHVINWEKEPLSEFIKDYIRPRGLKFSLGFALYDLYSKPRTIVALDKTKDENFSEDELEFLHYLVPQLNNMHKKFFYQQGNHNPVNQTQWETGNLTKREREITNFLCQGVSPANISKILYISQGTTYKHIAHIYEKFQVSSIQELLVRLLT